MLFLLKEDSSSPFLSNASSQGIIYLDMTVINWWVNLNSIIFYEFYPSPDATFQRRCSYTQWSGPLQGDGPKAGRCDWSGEPLSFLVSWPSCDSASTAGTDLAMADWCLHHLLPFRVGGQTGSSEAVPGLHWGRVEIPFSSRRFLVTGKKGK